MFGLQVASTPQYIDQLKIAPKGGIELIRQAAPTPAGPCCTVGTVADEITTALENIANAGDMGKHIPLLTAYDNKLHIAIDGGLASNPSMALVTGFSVFAAAATIKAAVSTVKEQNARIDNAKYVLNHIKAYQEARQDLALVLKNASGEADLLEVLTCDENSKEKHELRITLFKALEPIKKNAEQYLNIENQKNEYNKEKNQFHAYKKISKSCNFEKIRCFNGLEKKTALLQKWIDGLNKSKETSERTKKTINDEVKKYFLDNNEQEVPKEMLVNLTNTLRKIGIEFKKTKEKGMISKETDCQFLFQKPKKPLKEEIGYSKKNGIEHTVESCFKEQLLKKTPASIRHEITKSECILYFIENIQSKNQTIIADLKSASENENQRGELFRRDDEVALEKFIKEGIIESRSEKIIPGFLASAGISLIALGRFVPLATPVGQLIMAAYSAGNLKMSYRDIKDARSRLNTIRKEIKNEAEKTSQPKEAAEQTKKVLRDAQAHYHTKYKWAVASTGAWALNTAGMLSMGLINTLKWAVALAAAPISAGLSISAAALSDVMSSMMTDGMYAATAAVAAAALVSVPGNLKLRSREYMSLKPPKSWEKERSGDTKRDYIKNPFSREDVEKKILENIEQREKIKNYRASFFTEINNKKLQISKKKLINNIILWGSLGVFSNYVFNRKFKDKSKIASYLTFNEKKNQIRKINEIFSEPENTNPPSSGNYLEQIKNSPIVGDIAKLLARTMTRREHGETLFNQVLSEKLGEFSRNSVAARDLLEQAAELNQFGPCCDTTIPGQFFMDSIAAFISNGLISQDIDGDQDQNLSTQLKTIFERYVFNATNQYLVYQRHKELKEERATWHDLYTQQLSIAQNALLSMNPKSIGMAA